MEKVFYLIRHGQKEHNQEHAPLTVEGNRQAQITAQYFATLPIKRVVASPTVRTQQTAHYIATALNLTIETHELLRERAEWDTKVHKTFNEFVKEWDHCSRYRHLVPYNGNSSESAGRRLEESIRLYAAQKETHTIFVTHGGVIVDFLLNILKEKEMEALCPGYQTRLFEEILVRECSITRVTVHQKDCLVYKVHCFSDTAHLDKK